VALLRLYEFIPPSPQRLIRASTSLSQAARFDSISTAMKSPGSNPIGAQELR
jgi:hypothetical protein